MGGVLRVCPLRLPPDHLSGKVVLLRQLSRAHRQGLEPCEPSSDPVVANALRLQLLVDVFTEAHLPNAVDVTRCRAKTDPVEHVDDGLIVGGRRDCSRAPLRVDGREAPADQGERQNSIRKSPENTHFHDLCLHTVRPGPAFRG